MLQLVPLPNAVAFCGPGFYGPHLPILKASALLAFR